MENQTSESVTTIKDNTGNPAPLGLMGFGMTTVLLNLHNAGFYELGSMILAMGICYGGFAQIFAGIMEWKKNNTFGTVAFCSYGLFWWSLVALLILPKMGLASKVESSAMGAYLFMWGLFTFVMFFATLKSTKALQFVFITLAILFFLLAAADWSGIAIIKTIAGYEGIICGLSAIYTALAEVLNEHHGRTVWPIGQVSK